VALAASSPDGVSLRDLSAALETYDSSARRALSGLISYCARSSSKTSCGARHGSIRPWSSRARARAKSPARDLSGRAGGCIRAGAPARDHHACPGRDRARASSGAIEGTTVEEIEERRALRAEISRGRLLKGDLDKTLPLREHRDFQRVRPLGGIHPSLPSLHVGRSSGWSAHTAWTRSRSSDPPPAGTSVRDVMWGGGPTSLMRAADRAAM